MKHSARFLVFLLFLSLPAAARAQGSSERVQFGKSIVIETDEVVSEAVCIGCSIRIRGKVGTDAVAIGGSIIVDGTVGADAVAIGGSLDINGTVGVDAVAVGGSVRLGPESKVGGDVVAAGGKVVRHSQAQVGGELSSTPIPFLVGPGLLARLLLFGLLVCTVINLVLVLLAFLVAGERRVETAAQTLRTRAGLALLMGVGVLVGAVILFILSTLMGPLMPILAILVSLVLLITLLLGYTALSSWVGRALVSQSGPLAAVVIGALVITLVQLIPIVCFLAIPVFVLLALGSAALSGYGTAPDWLQQQLAARPAVPPAAPPPAAR